MLPPTQDPTPDTAASGHDAGAGRKRKAASQDNERLTKRLSLLNLGKPSILSSPSSAIIPSSQTYPNANQNAEKNGNKLYVPVEAPIAEQPQQPAPLDDAPSPIIQDDTPTDDAAAAATDDDDMYLDDSKHKVYIYNLDDELSSDNDDSDAASDDGRLVFLNDIDRHLRANRIPQHVLADDEGRLAGMQMVLYSDPRSLSVDDEAKDGVRKAIIESRRRLRESQARGEVPAAAAASTAATPQSPSSTVSQPTAPQPASDAFEESMDID